MPGTIGALKEKAIGTKGGPPRGFLLRVPRPTERKKRPERKKRKQKGLDLKPSRRQFKNILGTLDEASKKLILKKKGNLEGEHSEEM